MIPWRNRLPSLFSLLAVVLFLQPLHSFESVAAAPVGTNVFQNSLGMNFVPVKGLEVLFCLWETRVQDYRVFAEASDREWSPPSFVQTKSHPVVNVSWDDATAFCSWLTGVERNTGLLGPQDRYRLPKDAEWTAAVEPLAAPTDSPEQAMKSSCPWPWGHYWPPVAGDGNFAAPLKTDRFDHTAPVGSFKPNPNGLYDLAGNVWEWCDTWYNRAQVTKTMRGGSFSEESPGYLLTCYRFSGTMNLSNDDIGFRIVLERAK